MPLRPKDVLAEDPDFEGAARRILQQAAQLIGGRATTKYMRTGGTNVSMRNDRAGPGSLRRQTGRLARSLIGARASQLGGTEGVFDLSPTNNGVRLTYGSKVPYAAIHEYGGQQTVTPRQRRFFWGKYYSTRLASRFEEGGTLSTRAESWKAMALSETLNFPERPYLRPALEDSKEQIVDIAETEAVKVLFND